jgi:outer membrane autotransporter protein
MAGRLRSCIAAVALLAPSAGLAQVQVNQVFNLQGPSPSVGPMSTIQSGDMGGSPLQGSVTGAAQVVVPDPNNANRIYIGTPNGGVWTTSDGGSTWKPLTDNQASLSISSFDIDPTDKGGKTLIAGIGSTSSSCLTLNSNNCYATSGGTLSGLLYSQDGGKTWASLGGGSGPLLAQSGPLSNQFIDGVAARGSTILAASFQMSFFAQSTTAGGLYLSQDGGTTFKLISGTNGLPLGPVTSLVGVPGSPGTLYAAVTASSTSTYAQTSVYVTTDTGRSWKPVFTANDSNNLIQSSSQTAIKLATSPGGAVAIGVMNLNSATVTGLFWSTNPSAGSWTSLGRPAPNTLNDIRQIPINFAIAIDPKNPNMVYLSGDESVNASNNTVPVYRVDATASNPQFTSIVGSGFAAGGSTAHSDSRSLAFDANDNLILTSDGGVYLRTNPQSSAGSWQFVNGNLSNFQSYFVAYDSLNKRLAVAGQDNGVSLQPGTGNTSWNAQIGADGINVVINSKFMGNMSAMYLATDDFNYVNRIVFDASGNQISPSTSGFGPGTTVNCSYTGYSNCTTYGSNGGNSPFAAPIVLNRADPSMIAMAPGIGANDVYVGQDTTGPLEKSVNIKMTSVGTVGSTSTAVVTSLAYGIPCNNNICNNNTGTSANPNALLAGVSVSQNGQVWFSPNAAVGGGGSPLQLTSYSGAPPTSMVFDPTSPSAQTSPGQIRFYVADSVNLWGTRNQGAQFGSLTSNLPAGFTRPLAVEFISNNGVNALLVGGLNLPLTCTSQPNGCIISNQQSPITVADSDGNGNLSGWRAFGQGLPNTQISMLNYNADVDILAVGTYGRGAAVLYDVTSYFPRATVLQFGLANNDSMPDASYLTDGTNLNGTTFSRPLSKYGTGTLIIAGAATYTGGTTINSGILQLGNGGNSGSILGNVVDNGTLAFDRSDKYSFDGVISGTGSVVQFGSGKTILTAQNAYSGPTFVTGGTLSVNGSIASSSVFVYPGGTLGGNGTVGSTMILAGGVLAPGNSVGTLTVSGNLVFAAASLYMVELQGSSADRTNVTGTATLAGTVLASPLSGNLARSYSILSAAGGLSGTFNSAVAPALFTAGFGYTPTNVSLNLTSTISQISGLTRNESAVATALDNSFNATGVTFASLFGLSRAQLPAAMDMLSGEGVSGTQETAFGASSMFTSIMMDQGAFWRNRETVDVNGVTFAGQPLGYAAEKKSKTSDHPAFKSMPTKEPALFEQRWRAWLTSFDGTTKLNGEDGIGSATLSYNTGGLAAGLDYQFAPDLLAGFAIGGSTSNFSVRDRIMSGNLEGAHFGGYAVKTWREIYAAAALSFSTFRNSETRSIVGIGLTETASASFGSNLLSGRVEAGWKQSFNWFSVTPFAAVRVSQLWQNGFTETNPLPTGAIDQLGLTYNSKSVTSLPTFLGAQFDTRFTFRNGMALSPYARLSWVHEFMPDRTIGASFIALPAAAFTVDGPRAASDAARIDAGAKLAVAPNAWVFASFDGEFSSRGQSYAGKAGAKVAW